MHIYHVKYIDTGFHKPHYVQIESRSRMTYDEVILDMKTVHGVERKDIEWIKTQQEVDAMKAQVQRNRQKGVKR